MPEVRLPREPGDDDDEPLPDLHTRRSAERASKPHEKQEETKRPEPRTRPPGRLPRFDRWAEKASAPPPGGYRAWLAEQQRKDRR